MNNYHCPVCKKPLSKTEYEKALGILGEREKHLHEETVAVRNRLQKKAELLERALGEARNQVKKAREEGIISERSRTQRLLQGKSEEIRRLKDRIDQLKRGSTPQTEGLEFEDTLVERLKREFPEDDVQHKGHGGDILHVVIFDKRPAGTIIYECKRTPTISAQHIRQAFEAKQTRSADYGVLVTTGRRRDFNGFAQVDGVIIVLPPVVVHVAGLLRTSIIEMQRAKISKEKRLVVAQKLMDYITSPQFRNPVEEVAQLVVNLQSMVIEEFKDHRRTWEKRWGHYQKIHWDSSQIQKNLQLILHGKEPITLAHPKIARLQLPAPS